MKRYTTAQAIAILSKPGREKWRARAPKSLEWIAMSMGFNGRSFRVDYDKCDHVYCSHEYDEMINRSDWRIIKPKREKLRRIGDTANRSELKRGLQVVFDTDGKWEIFARKVVE